MRRITAIVAATVFWMAFVQSMTAQTTTNVYTVTNVVTVLVTNTVTITNVVTVLPGTAPAVVPIVETTAAIRQPGPKYPWKSSFTAGLTLTRGNSHSLLYYGGIESVRKTPANEYLLGSAGSYGSQDSEQSVNTYKVHGQWNHLFTERFYSYLRAEAMRDIVADVDYRITVGPGAGYYLVKNTNTTLSVEAGAGAEFQRIGETTLVGTNSVGSYKSESFATVRFAEKFEHKLNDRARLWQNMEILPQADEFDNYLVNFELGVETGLTKSVSLKTFMVDNFATQPASGRQKNDFKLVSGLTYKF